MQLWDKINSLAESAPDKDAFNTLLFKGLAYEKISYLALKRAVEECFNSLPKLTGSRVGLMISNRPLWAIYDIALTLKGATVVPIPHFFSKAQASHIISNAALELIVSEDLAPEAATEAPHRDDARLNVIKADTSLEKLSENTDQSPVNTITPEDNPAGIAKIIYTSGTTGTPKGVMISQAAIDIVIESLAERSEACASDRHLSLLPLATLIEAIGGLYVPLHAGATILYPESCNEKHATAPLVRSSLEYAKLIKDTRATTLNLVPAMLEGLILLAEEEKMPVPKALRFIACGGARLPSSLIEKAKTMEIPLHQGFGLSECTTVVALNSAANNRLGSVGIPLPHVSIDIARDGEIIVRSNALMKGYLGSNADNTTTWATGDLGYIDIDGYLYVTGRKDSAFATSAGRSISPEWIEGELLSSRAVSQAIVYGAGQQHPSALIMPELKWLEKTTTGIIPGDKKIAELLKEPIVRETLTEELNLAMSSLPEYATVKEFIFMESPFTKEAGELSPAGALKRKVILDKHSEGAV